jgi:hypothetical protein
MTSLTQNRVYQLGKENFTKLCVYPGRPRDLDPPPTVQLSQIQILVRVTIPFRRKIALHNNKKILFIDSDSSG